MWLKPTITTRGIRRRERRVTQVRNGGQLRGKSSLHVVVGLAQAGTVSLKPVRIPATVQVTLIAKERMAMALLGRMRRRREMALRSFAGVTVFSLCVLAGALSVTQTAGAAGPIDRATAGFVPARATILPDGRYVRPAGVRYNVGDFSLGLAVAPNGRCAASTDEGWGNGRPVPAVPKVNPAGTEPDEGVTAVNLATGATQFVTVNPKPAQNLMGIGLA